MSTPKPVPFVPTKTVEVQPEVTAKAAAGSGGSAKEPEKTFLGYPAFTWSKIIPLGLMFFCILFNYTILRDTKVRPSRTHAPPNAGPHIPTCTDPGPASHAARARQLCTCEAAAQGVDCRVGRIRSARNGPCTTFHLRPHM